MSEFSIDFITGFMVGIEFPPVEEIDEDLKFAVVVTLGIFRIVFTMWKSEA